MLASYLEIYNEKIYDLLAGGVGGGWGRLEAGCNHRTCSRPCGSSAFQLFLVGLVSLVVGFPCDPPKVSLTFREAEADPQKQEGPTSKETRNSFNWRSRQRPTRGRVSEETGCHGTALNLLAIVCRLHCLGYVFSCFILLGSVHFVGGRKKTCSFFASQYQGLESTKAVPLGT